MSIKHIARLLPLVLLFLVPNLSSAATESVRIIRQDCTGYSNCYTSLSAWEAGEQRDLTATDEVAVARIEGVWTNPDTTAVTIDGWTTDATRYVKIYTTPEARHAGVWSDTKYRLDAIASYTYALNILEPYTKVDGLQVKRGSGGGTRSVVYINATGVEFSNGIVTKNPATISSGISAYSAASGTKVWNNIVYNVDEFGLQGSASVYFYNNTVVNSGTYGIRGVAYSGTLINCKNNLVKGSLSGDYFHTGSGSLSCANSASGDATSATYGGTNRASQIFSFIDEANGNFHLSSSDTGALNAGVDLSTDPNLSFSTDIDGETRSGYWDIGADENTGAGGTPPPPPADTTAPTTPLNLTATAISSSQINLNWSASTDTVGVTGYRIYRDGTQITTTTGATYSNTGLSASTLYSYTVVAYDASGNTSSQSTSASATTQAGLAPDTTAPSIPTNLTATAISSSQINLSWTASTDAVGVTGYTIYRNGTQLTTTTGTTYSNTGLSASTLYTYAVLAYDLAGNASSQSSGASATTQVQGVVTTTIGAPVVFYTDIVSGPNTGGENNKGVFVRIFGKNFGTSRGTSYVTIGGGQADNYPMWSDTEIAFQLGANAQTGNIVVTNTNGSSSGLPFTVRTGNIYFVDINSPTNPGSGTFSDPWRSPNSFYNNAQPGDTMYMRGGTYSGQYGYQNWGAIFGMRAGTTAGFTRSGTQAMPIAYLAYPGETVTLSSPGPTGITRAFRLVMNSTAEPSVDWIVVGNFKMVAYDACVAIGGNPGLYALGWRIVNNDCLGLIRTTQAQTGSIVPGADYAKVLGNIIHGGRTANKLDHAIYSQACGDQIEIAWNHIYDNSFDSGPLISINYEGTRCTTKGDGYAGDIFVHDNIIDATNYPCRGVYAYEQDWDDGDPVLPMTYVYNNLFINTGGPLNNGSLVVRNGGMEAYNNSFYGNSHTCLEFSGPTPNVEHIVFRNNICHMKSTATSYIGYPQDAPLIQDVRDNIYYGLGNYTGTLDTAPINADPLYNNPSIGDFSLQSGSPAINKVLSLVSSLVTRDYFGISRPQGSAYDIGAFEYCTNCTTTTTTTTQPTSDTTAPSIPTNLSATAVSISQINLTWSTSTDNTAVTGYRIYRNGTQITTTTGTTYSNTGLSASTLYTYTVSAYDLAGNVSSQSTGASATTQNQPVADTTAPTITSIASSVTTTGATISWTTNEAGTSRVEYGLTTSYGNTTSLSTSLTSHSHTLSSLPPNTTYHYRVNTTDSAGNTATSQDRTFTTSAVSDTTAPSSITDLTTSSLGQTSLTLSWTVPTDTSGIASYDIRYSTTPITSTTFSSATQLTNVPLPTTSGSTQTQYVSVGLTPNTTYSFAIKSTDAVGNVSSLSNIATGTTLSAPTTTSTTASTQTGTVSVPTVSSGGGGGGGYTIYQLSDVTPPKNPTNVRIEPTNTQATLSWTNPTDPDFVRVKIVRKTGSAVSSHTDGTTVYDGTATTFTDTNLANNQTYYYAIYAYDKVPNYTSFIGLSATPQASLTQTNVSYTTIEAGCTETTTYSTTTGVPCTKVPTAFRPFYTFSKDRAVTYGMKDSTDVRELQKILQFEGLLSLASSADGAFGPGTKSAIIAFQKKYSITPAQGTVGPLTKTKLNQLYGSTTISTTFYRNLTIGSKGDDVKKLQQLLNTDIATRISATGAGSPGNETNYFGNATKAAVIKYQQKNNITPAQGYVGPLTRTKLEGR